MVARGVNVPSPNKLEFSPNKLAFSPDKLASPPNELGYFKNMASPNKLEYKIKLAFSAWRRPNAYI